MRKTSKILLTLFISAGLVAYSSDKVGSDNQASNQATQITESHQEELKEAYLNELSGQTSSWSSTFASFGSLMGNPNVGNDTWTTNVVSELITMQILVDNARLMTPPKELEASHRAYLKAMDHYEVIPTTLPAAIDNGDSAAIDRVITAMEKGNKEVQKASSLLNP